VGIYFLTNHSSIILSIDSTYRRMHTDAKIRIKGVTNLSIIITIMEQTSNFEGYTRSMTSSLEQNNEEFAMNPILLAVIMGVSTTIFFFTFFLIFATRWDRWITRLLATRTVYITPHFDQEGSSHLSEIIVRNESGLLSNSMVHESADESSVSKMFRFLLQF
jgi:hypothetical protein